MRLSASNNYIGFVRRSNSDSATTLKGASVTIPVLQNDTDVDKDALTVVGVTQPANGTVISNGNTVTFTPKKGFTGTTSFAYYITDGRGGSASANVSVLVRK